jgi:hypothetical protein
MYVIVVKNYVSNIKFVMHPNHTLNVSLVLLKKSNDLVLMCESCRKKIDLEKLLDLIFQKYIINNKRNMEFVLQFFFKKNV